MKFIITEDEVELKDGFSVLYFYAPWVCYHPIMKKRLLKIEEEFNIQSLAIDTDQFKSLAMRYDVSSLPTILVFKNGVKFKKIVGLTMLSALRNIFNVKGKK